MQETHAIVLEGTHSILKNFPVLEVFEINNHACVDLIEVGRLMAGHGAKFNFARNGKTGKRNQDGLNHTCAVDVLIEKVDTDMKDANIDEETRENDKHWLDPDVE